MVFGIRPFQTIKYFAHFSLPDSAQRRYVYDMRLFLILSMIWSCRLNTDKTPSAPPNPNDSSLVDSDDLTPPESDSSTPVTIDSADPDSAPGRRAVVLVMDGARIDETFGEGTSSVTGTPTSTFLPTIRADLLPLGSQCISAMNTGVTITSEGHAALLTGRHTALPNMRNDLGPGKLRPDFPTLFETVRAARGLPEESVLLMGNTVHLEGHLDSANPAWGAGASYGFVENPEVPGQPAGNDIDVLEALKSYLASTETHLAVVNLHNVDRTAHYNSNRAAYADRVRVLDEPIVSFWNWLQEQDGYADNTVLILVADHGRHRWGTDSDHRHHGDQCAGCREIPMFLMGPGVAEGGIVETPVDLTDLGVTLAHLLDVSLPYSHGNLIAAALNDPPLPVDAEDVVEVTEVGSHRILQIGTGQGSSIWRDGEQVSDSTANRAEAPIAASFGERAAYCWRELHLSDESIGNWPWRLQCHYQAAPGGPWQPIDGPVDIVWPFSRPSISMDVDGRIWMSLVDNLTGNWEAVSQAVRLARWSSDTGWRGVEFGEDAVLYPTYPSMVHTEGGTWVAYVTSDAIATLTTETGDEGAAGSPVELKARARHRRHIVISEVSWPDESTPTWNPQWRSFNADHFVDGVLLPAPSDAWPGWNTVARVDRPALNKVGPDLAMTFLSYGSSGGVNLGLVMSRHADASWSDPIFLDETGTVLPHMSPQWRNNRVAWVRYVDGTNFLCNLTLEDGGPSEPSCVPLLEDQVDHLRLTESGYLLSVKTGDTWSTQEGDW